LDHGIAMAGLVLPFDSCNLDIVSFKDDTLSSRMYYIRLAIDLI